MGTETETCGGCIEDNAIVVHVLHHLHHLSKAHGFIDTRNGIRHVREETVILRSGKDLRHGVVIGDRIYFLIQSTALE